MRVRIPTLYGTRRTPFVNPSSVILFRTDELYHPGIARGTGRILTLNTILSVCIPRNLRESNGSNSLRVEGCPKRQDLTDWTLKYLTSFAFSLFDLRCRGNASLSSLPVAFTSDSMRGARRRSFWDTPMALGRRPYTLSSA